ncbi:hypothetical protein MKW98_010172 [Papaver atlanticum]|uniref:F-box associated beta-propeller type 3 domain-containing protein n=1 Tax=Papaver atlanticum TaxID=357466 RepID=A0AAD4RXL9_9MAGN|nr:hypothetical protein MKW98_010172 [Papaver atlanticum]
MNVTPGCTLCLWNPTTRDHKLLKKRVPMCASKSLDGVKMMSYTYGMGYDGVNEDYKIVIASCFVDHEYSSEVIVYSLKTDSWKSIESNKIPPYSNYGDQHGVCVYGVLHWIADRLSVSGTKVGVIVAFDIVEDRFFLEGLAHNLSPEFLGVLDGELAMLCKVKGSTVPGFDVWVMKEYPRKETWTKMYTVNTQNLLLAEPANLCPIHIFRNGEILLEKDRDQKELVLYNPKLDSVRMLKIGGVPKWSIIESYLETLVSPNLGTTIHNALKFANSDPNSISPTATSEKELGNQYFKQKKFEQAIDCYSRSIALSPTAVAFANRAMANLKIKRYEEAENDCTEALNLDDRYIKAYSRRATARKELGKLESSLEDTESALRLEPNNQEVKKQNAEVKDLYNKEVLEKTLAGSKI